MTLWLSPDELKNLTGYSQRVRQLRALAEMNLKFRQRPADGFPLVDRSQFEGLERKLKPKGKLDFSSVEG